MSLLTINGTACRRCGICVQACPVSIIHQDENKFPFIPEVKEKRCILCGQCESICPDDALKHSAFQKIVSIDQAKVAAVNQENITEYFKSRRSIRSFLLKKVDRLLIEKVMDVVSYAPTGVNRQMNRWIVVSDSQLIRKVGEGVILWMKNMIDINPDLAKRLNFIGLVAAYEKGNDVICRNAPHLIIGYTETSYSAGLKDNVIAAAHLELLLPAFGLAGCWAGYLMVALLYSPDLKKLIGLDDSFTVHSALMVGYPKYGYYKIPERNKVSVSWL